MRGLQPPGETASASEARRRVIELYSVADAAKLFGLTESRLRYWLQSGFLRPSVRRGGRFFYTFQDLISVKAAKELLALGVPLQRVRRALDRLAAELPGDVSPASRLRVCSDGQTLVVVGDDAVYQPDSGQLVMAFAVSSLSSRIAEQLERDGRDLGDDGVPTAAIDAGPTERSPASPYQSFLDGLDAEQRGEPGTAEAAYRLALEGDPTLAAAHTNLGNLCHRRGEREEAARAYQRAIELDPLQPEARFNLGNLYAELGQIDLAIAELRQVVARSPDFADAHYNLGLLLVKVGGVAQAQHHLGRYLALDGDGEWAGRARALVEAR